MDSTTLWVPHRPRPKGRPRFAKGRTYTPKETVDAEAQIAELWPGPDTYEGPLAMAVTYHPNGQLIDIRPTDVERAKGVRGDIDNLSKLSLDGCVAAGAFDDRQVVVLNLRFDNSEGGQ